MNKLFKLIVILLVFTSCKEYLSVNSDKSKVVPSELNDLNAILENNIRMNQRFPMINTIASDDIMFVENDWINITQITPKNAYIWSTEILNDNDNNDWGSQYRKIFHANVIIQELTKIKKTEINKREFDRVLGSALFFRSYAYYELSQLFCLPYHQDNLERDGLPLRLDPDLNLKINRSSIKKTYEQILEDALSSLTLLPEIAEFKTQPSKVATYALLARIYLSMGDYHLALENAEKCLSLSPNLINYNEINLSLPNPFLRFNQEVIFHATAIGYNGTFPPVAKIPTSLYMQYDNDDLRKEAYFLLNNDKSFSFRGSYDGSLSMFTGLAVDEVVLIMAECMARLGEIELANKQMKHLLNNRMNTSFEYQFINDKDQLLTFILDERRKELIFRGVRWSDLRRLNMDKNREVVIERIIGDAHYVLKPNDSRYVFPIPRNAVILGGLNQN